jgi:hypothetical protein
MKNYVILFLVVAAAGTLANLLALKIAADQVQAQLDTGTLQNPILKLLTGK